MAAVCGIPTAEIGTGRYTPTGTTGSNVTTLTPRLSRWMRFGRLVWVFGELDVQPTLAVQTPTRFRLSLPFEAGFADSESVKGDFFGMSSGASGTIFATTGGAGDAQFAMRARHSDLRRYSFQFVYNVRTERVVDQPERAPWNPTPEEIAALKARPR